MVSLVTFLFIIMPFSGASYIPGTPGAPWTSKELFAIKGQLTWIMRNNKQALFKVKGGPVSFLEGKVDNWLAEVMTHSQAHFLHSSLRHKIILKVLFDD